MNRPDDVTALLALWQDGDRDALDRLVPLVYRQLKKLAVRQFRNEGSGHTLQPTALVHEAWARVVGQQPGRVENRVQFFALAAKVMRQVLVDHARKKAAGKRGGDRRRVPLASSLEIGSGAPAVDALDLHAALERLAAIQPRAARVVELRYFAGLGIDEVADVLDVTPRTVGRDWQTARLWLLDRLEGSGGA